MIRLCVAPLEMMTGAQILGVIFFLLSKRNAPVIDLVKKSLGVLHI